MKPLDPRVNAYRPDLAAASLKGVVRAERYVEPELRQVAWPNAPLTDTPDLHAPLASELLHGELFEVYEDRDGWAWGQAAADDYVGYAPSKALRAPGAAATHRVSAARTHVYPAPDIKARPALALPLGALVHATDRRGEFFHIHGGYVPACCLIAEDAAEEDFVAVAERLRDAPYLWGGRTLLGVDCSALVQLALTAGGYECPRDSDMQREGLPPAMGPAEPLRRGDIVFWRGHVGLMVDTRRILHANAHHMAVAVEPLEVAQARIWEAGGGRVLGAHRLAPPV